MLQLLLVLLSGRLFSGQRQIRTTLKERLTDLLWSLDAAIRWNLGWPQEATKSSLATKQRLSGGQVPDNGPSTGQVPGPSLQALSELWPGNNKSSGFESSFEEQLLKGGATMTPPKGGASSTPHPVSHIS
uniref:HDC16960 n=1 Tax=Drosophila melanogaster TaxID=7227 RepID=Q6IIU4_DROME|nr:TPA_inf: HDC16960 [Drosophila melanogaster]